MRIYHTLAPPYHTLAPPYHTLAPPYFLPIRGNQWGKLVISRSHKAKVDLDKMKRVVIKRGQVCKNKILKRQANSARNEGKLIDGFPS